jgi:hypothetical protein
MTGTSKTLKARYEKERFKLAFKLYAYDRGIT